MEIKNKVYADFIRGSTDAYEYIYNHKFSGIRSYISKIIKNDAVAEELAQDVFLKFWEGRESIVLKMNVEAYLITHAKNRAYNYIRDRAVEIKYVEHEKYVVDFLSTDSENSYQAQELSIIIKMLVSEMPEQRRKAFIMSREKGMTVEEIAAELGISPKTVYRHLDLAVDYLRKMLVIIALILSSANMHHICDIQKNI